jgi:secondary thiamine-phosphate synthase enzyme
MELVDITDTVNNILRDKQVNTGFCYLFNPHTTAGLTINEGADPDVKRDIIAAFQQMVPMQFDYHHREGNSPSHVMASLMGCSLTVAVAGGRLELGTWQKIFFCEFDGPRTRNVHWRLDNHLNP